MRTALLLAGLVVATVAFAAAPTASAGAVGLVDHACDTVLDRTTLTVTCAIDCRFASPTLQATCLFVDGLSAWDECAFLLSPVPACDPNTYKCASTDPLLDFVCREGLNAVLDEL